jgi:FkbM family methyltransferase
MNIEKYIKQPSPISSELGTLFDPDSELTIFDIGSCEGEDAIRYSKMFPNSRVFAFEPLQSNLSKIRQNVVRFSASNIIVISTALSDFRGTGNFYISSGRPDNRKRSDWDYGNKSSSLFKPYKVTEYHPWLSFSTAIQVDVDTLRNVCLENKIDFVDLVHLDVQGAELNVLRGAKDYISKFKLIWLEAEVVQLYEGQPLKEQIEGFMRDNSFVKLKDTVGSVSGDMLYVNTRFFEEDIIRLARKTMPFKGFLSIFQNTKNKVCSRYYSVLANLHVALSNSKFLSSKKSFSQSGEDRIIKFALDSMGIQQPKYLDIGAYHPYKLSNTAIFYESGSKGLNVEPNPDLFSAFLKRRKRDVNLNVGICDSEGEMAFYIMSPSTLSTFSYKEAQNYVREGHQISCIKKVSTTTIPQIVKKYFDGVFPEILSIDTEGMDLIILKTIDFSQSSPVIICVETISFSSSRNGKKNMEILDFLDESGYFVYADTYINTVFVKKDSWRRATEK